ncbi:MAG: M20 family metallo-hydrolase [Synergistaceae bacterium]|nr:M20 family metallo-hydrolase [Synergistaceae bacterium]
MHEKILSEAKMLETKMVETLTRLCRIPAISPHNGGTGEDAKLHELEKIINELNFPKAKLRYEYVDDEKSPTKKRASLFLEYPGKKSQRICILTHIDVVPEGDRTLWSFDPFSPEVRGTRLYGRGVSDNGGCLISSLFALKALLNSGVEPEYSILLAFVSDEEMGSHYGLEKLIERENLFRHDDLVIVPDSGNDAGDFIEVTEKSVLRLYFTVIGKQVHASLPHTGINACRVANMLAYEVDEKLNKTFTQQNDLFDPPFSTFEPTRRFTNVPNVNTVPGRERFDFDCRILPEVSLDEVIKTVEDVRKNIEAKTGAKINLEIERSDAAPATDSNSEVVKMLVKNIREVLNVEPKIGGVGGGTFAVFFRRKNIPAVVWSLEAEGVAHQPDEFTEIKYLVNNAKVFALMMLGE